MNNSEMQATKYPGAEKSRGRAGSGRPGADRPSPSPHLGRYLDDPYVASLTTRIRELQAVLTELRQRRIRQVARLRAKERYRSDPSYREILKSRARGRVSKKREIT